VGSFLRRAEGERVMDLTFDTTKLTIQPFPKAVGYFYSDYTRIQLSVYRKPRWLTRVAIKLIFEWSYEDA
jgi:hypothetical protein